MGLIKKLSIDAERLPLITAGVFSPQRELIGAAPLQELASDAAMHGMACKLTLLAVVLIAFAAYPSEPDVVVLTNKSHMIGSVVR